MKLARKTCRKRTMFTRAARTFMQNRRTLIERSKSYRKSITAAFVMSRTCSLNVALSAIAATSAQTIQFASSCISLFSISRCSFASRCISLALIFRYLSLFCLCFDHGNDFATVRTLIIDQLRNEC